MKERLKTLRKSLGLTQVSFGEKIGMSDTSISHMEAGRTPINDQNIRMICMTFGVRENWFRTGDGEMIDKEVKMSEYQKRLLNFYKRLSPTAQKILIEYAEKLFSDECILLGQASTSAAAPDPVAERGTGTHG
jgi:transcriptional regulator with XRE-family HTH domain